LTGSRRHIFKFSCRALVDGELAASADLLIAEQLIAEQVL